MLLKDKLSYAKWILISISFFIVLTGCANKADENENAQPYQEDGMLGITNTNPNLPTSPSYHTYSKDQKLAQKVIDEFAQISRSRIVMDGPKLTLYYAVREDMDVDERKKLEEKLRDRLSFQLPRYDIILRHLDDE